MNWAKWRVGTVATNLTWLKLMPDGDSPVLILNSVMPVKLVIEAVVVQSIKLSGGHLSKQSHLPILLPPLAPSSTSFYV